MSLPHQGGRICEGQRGVKQTALHDVSSALCPFQHVLGCAGATSDWSMLTLTHAERLQQQQLIHSNTTHQPSTNHFLHPLAPAPFPFAAQLLYTHPSP